MKLTPMKSLYPVQTLFPTATSYSVKPQCITDVNQQEKQPHSMDKTLNNLESHNLSSSASLSRRSNELRKRWMEYQGMNNWEGLLDPLDNNLRVEILRYGKFVDAAYKSFEFDPSSPSYGSCKFPKNTLLDNCGLPNTGYKVTKHLIATSSIQLPRWMNMAPTWASTRSSYIGYVAVCDDKEEIKRLGRRDIVIAYRGTATCFEWLENLRATLTHLPTPCKRWRTFHKDQTQTSSPMVESGFLSLYTSPCNVEDSDPLSMSLQHMVRQEIGQILQNYRGEPLSLTITGHSLGAALAILTAYDINATFVRLPMMTVVLFGGPRVGNWCFKQELEKKGTKVLRIVNSNDVVTKVPGFVLHENDGYMVTKRSGYMMEVQGWMKKKMERVEWVYAEVGEELRLCSKDSPYIRSVDVATCHQLNTYLHLVDGFISSKCRFRATTKRFLP